MYAHQKPSKMQRKSSSPVTQRAWNVIRLALLWARKGGLFRNRHVITLSVFSKLTKKLLHSTDRSGGRGALAYGDRELSFDDTPVIHVKMHRPSSMRFKLPHLPCINPEVDFDYDFEEEYYRGGDDRVEEEEDEEIDLKAEEFIEKFYEQMKLQRQKSLLRYN